MSLLAARWTRTTAGKTICPSIQPHDWRPCEASEAGFRRAVHYAAAWLVRRVYHRADPSERLQAVFP
jgi:hypothetical protein